MSVARTIPARVALAAALVAIALLTVTVAAAEAKKVKLKGDQTALTPDAGTFGALADAGFEVAPVGSATARGDGSIAFPITGGRVNPKSLKGFIAHGGGLSFTKDDTTVVARRFVIRTDGKRPYLTARVGGGRLKLLTLGSIEREDRGGKIVVTAHVALAKQAAKALNRAFDTNVFKRGTSIGSAEVTASA
jgi:hypothetical protein